MSARRKVETEAAAAARRVFVVGTLNVDHVWRVPTLPRAGETVLAETAARAWGGKGANLAVAAARQGARVLMIGALGDDAEGELYRQHLEREGIDTRAVLRSKDDASGTAHVYVDAKGENQIVVSRGANRRLDAAAVAAALEDKLRAGDVLAVGLEIPAAAAAEALRCGARQGVRTVFNPSPIDPAFTWGSTEIDTVIVNEHECAAWFEHAPSGLRDLAPGARQALLRRRAVRHLIVTQGGEPTLRIWADGVQTVATHPVKPVDTVGAGDTFAGALAAQLAAGADWPEALAYANVAAALSTLTPGAQTGIPTRARVAAAIGAAGN